MGSGLPTTTLAAPVGSSITRRFNAFGVRKVCGCSGGGDAKTLTSTAPPTVTAEVPSRVRAMDFQFDVTTDQGPIKIVSIVDEHTRECLGGMGDRSITSSPNSTAGLPSEEPSRRSCAVTTGPN